MKFIRLILIVFIPVVVVSCTMMQMKEEINDGNIFILRNPSIHLDIADDLVYAGKYEGRNKIEWKYEIGEADYKVTTYLFTKDDKFSIGVMITIKKIQDQSIWLPITVKENFKGLLVDQSAIQRSGKTWQTWTFISRIDDEMLKVTDAMLLSPGHYYFGKKYSRLCGDKTMVTITYLEDISERKRLIRRHLSTQTLPKRGYARVGMFLNRANENVKFIE